MHLVEVTFTTDFALVDRVASKTAQHKQLCKCLAHAGRWNVKLHLFIVGHTGIIYLDSAKALLDLGITASRVQPALEAIAVMGCKILVRIAQGLLARTGGHSCSLSRCAQSCCCAFAAFTERDRWEDTSMLVVCGRWEVTLTQSQCGH